GMAKEVGVGSFFGWDEEDDDDEEVEEDAEGVHELSVAQPAAHEGKGKGIAV
ncbi:hypothetical protein LTR33_009765, partial [Friedmanniomyces endolithicus]